MIDLAEKTYFTKTNVKEGYTEQLKLLCWPLGIASI